MVKVLVFKKVCCESEFINVVKVFDLSGLKILGWKNSFVVFEEYLNNDELFFVFGINKYLFEVWSIENLSDFVNYKKNGSLFSYEMLVWFDEMV